MILVFKTLFPAAEHVLDIECPHLLCLRDLLQIAAPGWGMPDWFIQHCWFYSRAEDGLLDPDLPLCRLPIAAEDEIILVPANHCLTTPAKKQG